MCNRMLTLLVPWDSLLLALAAVRLGPATPMTTSGRRLPRDVFSPRVSTADAYRLSVVFVTLQRKHPFFKFNTSGSFHQIGRAASVN